MMNLLDKANAALNHNGDHYWRWGSTSSFRLKLGAIDACGFQPAARRSRNLRIVESFE
jgi:hypothetical protein